MTRSKTAPWRSHGAVLHYYKNVAYYLWLRGVAYKKTAEREVKNKKIECYLGDTILTVDGAQYVVVRIEDKCRFECESSYEGRRGIILNKSRIKKVIRRAKKSKKIIFVV